MVEKFPREDIRFYVVSLCSVSCENILSITFVYDDRIIHITENVGGIVIGFMVFSGERFFLKPSIASLIRQ